MKKITCNSCGNVFNTNFCPDCGNKYTTNVPLDGNRFTVYTHGDTQHELVDKISKDTNINIKDDYPSLYTKLLSCVYEVGFEFEITPSKSIQLKRVNWCGGNDKWLNIENK